MYILEIFDGNILDGNFFDGNLSQVIFRRKFYDGNFSTEIFRQKFFDEFFLFFGRILLTYNLLTIASFRIGVPSILFFSKIVIYSFFPPVPWLSREIPGRTGCQNPVPLDFFGSRLTI